MSNAINTPADLLADYNRAIDLAIFDAERGEPRWLRQLAGLGAKRAASYPAQRRGFQAAQRRAERALRRVGS